MSENIPHTDIQTGETKKNMNAYADYHPQEIPTTEESNNIRKFGTDTIKKAYGFS